MAMSMEELRFETPEAFDKRIRGNILDEVREGMRGHEITLTSEESKAFLLVAEVLKRTGSTATTGPVIIDYTEGYVTYYDVAEALTAIVEICS